MELSGLDHTLDRQRLAGIRAAARRYLRGWRDGDHTSEWMGLRPLLPDGLPAIGRLPGLDNAYVATGHGMLGMTLAPATAAAIAELICLGHSDPDLAPFDPARFDRHAAASRPR
jgi:D-amino-acid dehydrogenase